jgi:hypothetical protein
MNGPITPALLCASLGLAIAKASVRTWLLSMVALCSSAIVVDVSRLAVPQHYILLACWLSVIANAACVHVRRRMCWQVALALSISAGSWSGAVNSQTAATLDLLWSLPWILIAAPAALLIRHRAEIAVKVVSSWLIAVAVMAAALAFLPVIPGYLPDHLE